MDEDVTPNPKSEDQNNSPLDKGRFLLSQYDRFINQLRVEVQQTFWLYSFFFAIDSALLSTVFLKEIQSVRSIIIILTGIVLSFYWRHIMLWKNKWREWWLNRINEIEQNIPLIKDNKLQMWSSEFPGRPERGLWKFLFSLPICFIVIWIILLLIWVSNEPRFMEVTLHACGR